MSEKSETVIEYNGFKCFWKEGQSKEKQRPPRQRLQWSFLQKDGTRVRPYFLDCGSSGQWGQVGYLALQSDVICNCMVKETETGVKKTEIGVEETRTWLLRSDEIQPAW